MSTFQYPTEYFLQEGKGNLSRCLRATFDAVAAHNIKQVIIFTSAGQGVMMALQEYISKEQFSDVELVAVTFPDHTNFSVGDPSEHRIPASTCDFLSARKVPIVRAHLPFEPIRSHYEGHGILGQDLSLIGNALRIFCGSMSLCVQAVLMASDAGHVKLGDHVIAMSSDTSILVRSAGTSRFLTDFIVREIICKPVLLTIGKSEKAENVMSMPEESSQMELPAPNE